MKHYWQQALASIGKLSPHGREQCPDTLRHEIAALTTRNQTLAAELGQLRTDFEQTRSQEHRKRAELEQRCDAGEAVLARDRNRLDVLERQVGANEREHRQTRDRVGTLETSLAGHSDRLEHTDQHVEALAARSEEQTRICNATLSQAAARLEEAEEHARSVEQRVESRHRSLTAGLEGIQLALARHARRLNWSITGAGFALLLGMGAGALLIRDVQDNSRVIAGMSGDLKVLLSSFDEYQSTRHGLAQQPSRPPPPAPLPPASETTVQPEPHPAPVRETQPAIPAPAPPWGVQPATAGRHDVNRYFLGSDLDLFLQMNSRVTPAATRQVSGNSTGGNALPAGIVETPSGLQYQVVVAGSGKTPTLADRVVLDYLSSTPDGTILVDTYAAGAPVTYNMTAVAAGWQEALLLMQEGAEWGLYVPPQLAQRGGIDESGMSGRKPGFHLIKLLKVIEGEGHGQQQ